MKTVDIINEKTDDRRTVIALVKYARTGASSRVRFWNLLPALKDRGWNICVHPFFSNEVLVKYYKTRRHSALSILKAFRSRVFLARALRGGVTCWIEKEVAYGLPDLMDSALGPSLSRCLVDYDDGVFLRYRDDCLGPIGRAAKFRRYALTAGKISVGSDYLGRWFSDRGAQRLVKIPSTVAVHRYPVHLYNIRGPIKIGWIGTPMTAHFLDELRSVLHQVAKRYSIEFHVVGAKWECYGVNIVCHPWSEDSETALVSSFDIGVMPLVDGDWERAKCGYKLIQYMAAGVVPMGSRIGENKVIIDDGVNGYLASTHEEWVERLCLLCANIDLRASFGRLSREKAIAKYDIRCSAGAVDEALSFLKTSSK